MWFQKTVGFKSDKPTERRIAVSTERTTHLHAARLALGLSQPSNVTVAAEERNDGGSRALWRSGRHDAAAVVVTPSQGWRAVGVLGGGSKSGHRRISRHRRGGGRVDRRWRRHLGCKWPTGWRAVLEMWRTSGVWVRQLVGDEADATWQAAEPVA
jgi:hypothetical protein